MDRPPPRASSAGRSEGNALRGWRGAWMNGQVARKWTAARKIDQSHAELVVVAVEQCGNAGEIGIWIWQRRCGQRSDSGRVGRVYSIGQQLHDRVGQHQA